MKPLFYKTQVKAELMAALRFFIKEYKRPLWMFQNVPSWGYWTLTSLTLLLVVSCGLIRGLVNQSPIQLILAIIFLPFFGLALYWGLSALVHQVVLRIFKQNITFTEMAPKVFVALIPYWLLFIFSGFIKQIDLVGLFISYIFLSYGLSSLFLMKKRPFLIVFGLFYAVFIGYHFSKDINQVIQKEIRSNDWVTELSIKILKEEF